MVRLIATLLLWSLALICAPGFARAAGVVKEIAAAIGDAVPEAGADAYWMNFSSPYLDADGNLALHGFVRLPQSMDGIQVCTVRTPDGDTQLRARVGGLAPVPQSAEDPVTISSLNPYGCQGGHVLFRGSIDRSGSVSSATMVSTPNGLQIVAQLGEQLVGMPEPIVSFSSVPRLDPGGGVTFSVSGADYFKSYTYRRELGSAPQLIGISEPPSILLGSKAGFGVVSASFTGLGASKSIRRLHPDRSVTIAQHGLPIPGNEPFQFTSALVNSCNDAGKVLIMAGYAADGQLLPSALWLSDGENPAERIAQLGETIHGTTITVQDFEHYAVNGAGDVAFFSNSVLCLKRQGQPLIAVAYLGMPIPPSGSEMQNVDASGLQLSADGNLVFRSGDGLWVYTASHQLLQIARLGERIVRQGVEYVINKAELLPSGTGGQDGRRRMLSDNGRVAFLAELIRVQDNSTGPGVIVARLIGDGDPAGAPIAAPDNTTVRGVAGVATRIPVLENDRSPVGRAFKLHSVTQGTHGRVSIDGTTVRYVPGRSFAGEDLFTYTIVDAEDNYGTAR